MIPHVQVQLLEADRTRATPFFYIFPSIFPSMVTRYSVMATFTSVYTIRSFAQ